MMLDSGNGYTIFIYFLKEDCILYDIYKWKNVNKKQMWAKKYMILQKSSFIGVEQKIFYRIITYYMHYYLFYANYIWYCNFYTLLFSYNSFLQYKLNTFWNQEKWYMSSLHFLVIIYSFGGKYNSSFVLFFKYSTVPTLLSLCFYMLAFTKPNVNICICIYMCKYDHFNIVQLILNRMYPDGYIPWRKTLTKGKHQCKKNQSFIWKIFCYKYKEI